MSPQPVDRIKQQLTFLDRSAKHYDAGEEDDAIRLATTMRVLFHDTRESTSVMTLTGLKGSKMLTSSRGLGDWRDYLAHEINFQSAEPIKMKPLLGDTFREIQMEDWWSQEVVFAHNGQSHSRSMIVKAAANRDGGAHVDDKKLQAYYRVLQAGEYAIGITTDFTFDGPPLWPQGETIYPNNAHLALLRQFAHEVTCSAKHFGW
ncbi:hypothetical protein ABZ413_17340 [Nocardia rhamnosiphila]|uniref:hypothetical protein n=1 Tax=Nocardia rhamnosiphila TaxID=426716 RepID=UPI003402792D